MRLSHGGRLLLELALTSAFVGWVFHQTRVPPKPLPPAPSMKPPTDVGATQPVFAAADDSTISGLASDATTPPVAPKRIRRIGLESTVFLTIFVILGVSGFFLLPPIEDVSKLPTDFSISAYSPDDQLTWTSLTFREEHESDETVISITSLFAKNTLQGTKFSLNVILPYRGAIAEPCDRNEDLIDETCSLAPDSNTLSFHGSLRGNSNGVTVSTRIIGIPGVGFKASSERVEAHFPTFDLRHADDFRVDANYQVSDIDKFSWSGTEPDYVSERGARWSYIYSDTSRVGAASGIREDLVSRHSLQTFLAGTALGLAGAAFIAALQAVFVRASSIREAAGKSLNS